MPLSRELPDSRPALPLPDEEEDAGFDVWPSSMRFSKDTPYLPIQVTRCLATYTSVQISLNVRARVLRPPLQAQLPISP